MEAQVRTSGGATLARLFKLNNDRGSWTRVTADLSAYRGQIVTLWFNVHLNGPNPNDDTWMYLDDVAVGRLMWTIGLATGAAPGHPVPLHRHRIHGGTPSHSTDPTDPTDRAASSQVGPLVAPVGQPDADGGGREGGASRCFGSVLTEFSLRVRRLGVPGR